jgi:taurine transport system substrate-binding protein
MSAAMASGDVQLSVSQGVPPFVVATSAGQDLQILDVAVSYADNDNCVVRSELEIDASNAGELAGKKVAVPLGTAAHYGFLKQMSHFGVDVASMDVVDMDPPDGAAAIAQGAVDMFCGWGGSLRRALEHGNVLLTGDEKTALGILVFDVTSGPADWVAENGGSGRQVPASDRRRQRDVGRRGQPRRDAAGDRQGCGHGRRRDDGDHLDLHLPDRRRAAQRAWLGGNAATFMKGVADVFVEAGSIDAARHLRNAVNTGPLSKRVGGM